MNKFKTLTVICLVFLASVSAYAVPVVYTGYDVGSSSLATSPLAVAAAAAFDAATGPLSLVNYEAAALPAGFSQSALNRTNNSGCAANLCGYNTTVAGAFFHLQVGGSQTFSFTTPIDSFGAYFTGWQIGTQTIVYTDSSTVTLNMGTADINNGGTRFFGFVDAGKSIASITYNAQNDIIAVDDVRYGKAKATVPEPSSLVLLGLSLLGVGVLRSRKVNQ